MRILIINLLAVALLLMGAASASAFAINHSIRGGLSSYSVSDVVVVDVFLDAPTINISLLSVSVMVDDATFSYDKPASAALPIIYPAPAPAYGTTGAQPGYILYTAAGGMMGQTILYPTVTPAYNRWAGIEPPGLEQINVDLAEPTFSGAAATGVGIWIASLVFHVDQDFIESDVILSLTGGGNIVTTRAGTDVPVIVSDQVALTAPITISGHLPEPATATLIGLGLVGLCLAGRRKA